MSERPATGDQRPSLENFLAGKPLNERMARIMRGEDEEEEVAAEVATQPKTYADGTPITDPDREHLRRTMATPGWQVLLKLLDTALQSQEDAARRMSKDGRTPSEEIVTAWRDLAGAAKARTAMVALAEAEVALKRQADSSRQKQGARNDKG